MKNKMKTVIALTILCGALLAGMVREGSAGEILIIANPSVPANVLDQQEIQKIFLGKIAKWSNDDMVTIVVSKEEQVHKRFLNEYVKRSANQFQMVWRQNLFTGKGKIPVQVNSMDELVEYVANTEGAIGYISSTESVPEQVKVISQ